MVIGECAAVLFGQHLGRRFLLNADAEILRDGPNLIGKVIENLGNDFPYGTFGFFNGDDSVQPFNSASAAGESGCRRARRVSR